MVRAGLFGAAALCLFASAAFADFGSVVSSFAVKAECLPAALAYNGAYVVSSDPAYFSDDYWKVWSELHYDYLRFYIDAAEQTQIHGYVDWEQSSYAIGSGTHTLKWAYTKDGSVSIGTDAGWLDRVVYTISTCPDCPANGIITNATYPAGTTCSCSNATSITLGSNVTVESGAIVTFTAPKVNVQPGFHGANGSTIHIKQ